MPRIGREGVVDKKLRLGWRGILPNEETPSQPFTMLKLKKYSFQFSYVLKIDFLYIKVNFSCVKKKG